MRYTYEVLEAVVLLELQNLPHDASSNGNISALLALYGGIRLSPVDSAHKDQGRVALMFSFICA